MAKGTSDDFPLPLLREDLRIEKAAPLLNGVQTWVIYDPVRHRFFQVGRRVIAILAAWRVGRFEALRTQIAQASTTPVDADEVKSLISFLSANELTAMPISGQSVELAQRFEKKQKASLLALAKAYLFFRIPLVRPDRFLEATLPFARVFFSRWFLAFVLLASVIGLGLVLRQADKFLSYASQFFSLEGAAAYGVAIILVKIFHELGHAYQAKMRGITVPSMGIAFMVMFPLLYTDVSDAWRTKNRRDKLMIDAGGVMVELCLAAIATVLWVFLPDGPIRMVMFSVATTSWVLSLFVNLNPFMRFDGYYFLSDATGLQNLQPRSFALMRWWIREALFGLRHPPTETVQRSTAIFMVSYAVATSLYRLVLFIGIALLVYHIFFKALGVLLFVIEIFFFIALPVIREIIVWFKLRSEIMRRPRSYVTFGVVFTLLAFLLWPMPVTIHAPATLEYAVEAEIFPPENGQFTEVYLREDTIVPGGALLFKFASPELDNQRRIAEERKSLLELRLARGIADREDRALRRVLEGERTAVNDRLDGLNKQIEELSIFAPFEGQIVDVDDIVQTGAWVGRGTRLARIIQPGALRVRGYLTEYDLPRIDIGIAGVFVPDDPAKPKLDVSISAISRFAVDKLLNGYLGSDNKGPIPLETERDQNGTTRPYGSWFSVDATTLIGTLYPLETLQTGVIVIRGRSESWGARIVMQIARVLVRESTA